MKKQLLLVLLLLLGLPVTAQMPGWSTVKAITVKELSGADITGYQLKITLNTADLVSVGNMAADGSDIRFTDACNGGTVLPYWIESGMNTASTVIWVKVDLLPASSYKTIYMHSGNSLATAVSSLETTLDGPFSATDSLSGGTDGLVTDCQRGFRFVPLQDVFVTAFGKNEPNGTTRYLTLFDYDSQSILQQIQVSGAANLYAYGNLPQPVWLTEGTNYVMELYSGSGESYKFGAAFQMSPHIQYMDMRYCNGCSQNTFPSYALNNIQYGYPDFQYYIHKKVTPAPEWSYGPFVLTLADTVETCSGVAATLAATPAGGTGSFTFVWTGNGVTGDTTATVSVQSSASAYYLVTANDACGIPMQDSVYLNVYPVPSGTIVSSDSLICNGEYAELSFSGSDVQDYEWVDGPLNDTLIAMPSLSTVYTVNATSSFGCMESFTYTQHVNEPAVSVRDISICHGSQLMYNGSVYDSTGIYVDTITGITNCDSIVTTNLTVMELPETTRDISICFGTSYTVGNHVYNLAGTYTDTIPGAFCDTIVTTHLDIAADIDAQAQAVGFTLVADVGGDSYQWIDCSNNQLVEGAVSSYLEVTQNGSYAALVTIGNCTKQTNCIAVSTIGLEEPDMVDNLSVFPNPNDGAFTVRSSVSQTVMLTDAFGNVLRTGQLTAGQSLEMVLPDAAAGIYFLKSRTRVIRLMVK